MSVLRGKRILVVEDEFVVAVMVEDMLIELGAVVVGPAGTMENGCQLAQTETIDAAVLDINLNGERSDPIAEILEARGIPFVFATGYDRTGRESEHAVTVLEKPYDEEKLAEALAPLVGAAR